MNLHINNISIVILLETPNEVANNSICYSDTFETKIACLAFKQGFEKKMINLLGSLQQV